MRKALAKKESERFQSAGEFAVAFCQAAGEPVPVLSGFATVERKTAKRKKASGMRTLVKSIASVAVVAVVALVLYTQLRS